MYVCMYVNTVWHGESELNLSCRERSPSGSYSFSFYIYGSKLSSCFFLKFASYFFSLCFCSECRRLEFFTASESTSDKIILYFTLFLFLFLIFFLHLFAPTTSFTFAKNGRSNNPPPLLAAPAASDQILLLLFFFKSFL